MAAHQQRLVVVELDAVDRREEGDDREGVGHQVGDDPDLGGGAGQRLGLQELDPDLLHAVQEGAQRPLLREEEVEEAHLELEVVVVGGDHLHAAGGAVEKPPVLVGSRPQGLLDHHDVAQVVVAGERRQVGRSRGGDVRDDVAARLELAPQLVACRCLRAVPVEVVPVLYHLQLALGQALPAAVGVSLDDVDPEVEELLEGEQVVVGLVAPLAEAEHDEVLLDVLLLLGQGVQPGVLDGDRCLGGETPGQLHLLVGEGPRLVALGEHRRADRLAAGQEGKREERAHSEGLGVGRVHEIAGPDVVDQQRLVVVQHLEEEGGRGSLTALPSPQALLVGGGRPEPSGAVLLVESDLAGGRIHQPHQVAGHQAEGLVEVDGGGDRPADVRAQLELLGVPASVLVQPGRLDRDGDLRGGRLERLHLGPVRPPAGGAVVADLQDAGRGPAAVEAQREEDADQVGVAAGQEDLRGQREPGLIARRLLGGRLDQATRDGGDDAAVLPDHRDLEAVELVGAVSGDRFRVSIAAARKLAHHRDLPVTRHEGEHVRRSQGSLLLERPPRHPVRSHAPRRVAADLQGVDRLGGRGASGHPHHHVGVADLLDQVDAGEVEVELGDPGVGQVRDDRLQDLHTRRAGAQHGVGHPGEGAQEAVAALQVVDQPLPRQGASDQVCRGLEVDLGGGRHPHGRQLVSAQDHQAAAGQAVALEAEDAGRVQTGADGRPADRGVHRLIPAVHALRHPDPAGGGHRRVRGQQLQVLPVGGELVGGGAVEVGRQQELGEGDGHLAAEGGPAVGPGGR